jgi:predicted acyltransferase
VEIRRRPTELAGWARCFEVFGRNPLFIFVLSGFVPRVLALLRWADGTGPDGLLRWTSPLPWLYEHAFAGIGGDPRLGSFLYALTLVAGYGLLARGLDRRRIYIRV